MIEDLHAIVSRIEGDWRETRVLVVGDVMLDRYIWGDVERISPEAPVPVVRLAHRSEQPGGAANVAMNIAGLGARVTLAGFVGQDEERTILEACLAKAGVDAELTAVPGHPTTSKLRILGGNNRFCGSTSSEPRATLLMRTTLCSSKLGQSFRVCAPLFFPITQRASYPRRCAAG